MGGFMTDLQNLKEIIKIFMNKYDLRGIEVVKITEGEYSFRACGLGMIHKNDGLEGLPIYKQIDLWDGLQDYLQRNEIL